MTYDGGQGCAFFLLLWHVMEFDGGFGVMRF